jgi:hypothetical protein
VASAGVSTLFSARTTTDADEVNGNFTELVDFLNDNVLHKDGSKEMLGFLSLPTATSTNHAANKAYVDNKFSASVGTGLPVGSQILFPGETLAGYVKSNGQALSVSAYSALYAVIGETYGSNRWIWIFPPTLFNVPNNPTAAAGLNWFIKFQ